MEHVRKLRNDFAHVRFRKPTIRRSAGVGQSRPAHAVILNLVKNAAEAVTQGGQVNPEIVLATGFPTRHAACCARKHDPLIPLLVTVRDNGRAFPKTSGRTCSGHL
jgi:nitrogen fixation/metabolism regulation signal transduction histidine kinase